jgi:hypothetical protein
MVKLRRGCLIFLLLTVTVLAACTSAASVAPASLSVSDAVKEQKYIAVTKDGIRIDCPAGWNFQEVTGAVYQASLTDYLRITVALLSPQPQAYYDSLVADGTVRLGEIAGDPTYSNDYIYSHDTYQLVSKCFTIVHGTRACHIMILCDTALLDLFEPLFEHVENSVKFG